MSEIKQTAAELIHTEVMESCDNNPALNGCGCPKCGNTVTYDVQWNNNYYFGCVDCQQVVAIWIESDISDKTGEPWFLIGEPLI